MLEVSELHVKYGIIEALHGISFRVNKGEIVALLGANGAGKSTTLMSIMRLPPPEGPQVSKGEIKFDGTSLLPVSAHTLVSRYGIGLVPEGRHIFGNLTVYENLKLATYARKDREQIQRDYDRVFTLFPRLADRKSQRGDLLSGGEQQMLAIGRAFMCGVGFILLDEPADHQRRVGGNAVLEILQFLGQADADQVRPGAEHLPEFDRGRPELLNRQPQTDLPAVAGDGLALMRLEEVFGEIRPQHTDPVRQSILAQDSENLPPAVDIPVDLRN